MTYELINDICLFIWSILFYLWGVLASIYHESIIYLLPWLFISGYIIYYLSNKYHWWIKGLMFLHGGD